MQFDRDIGSPHKTLFLAVRAQVLSFDGVEETKKERITTYAANGAGLCHIRTMPHGVDVGFLKGAFLQDPHGLLHGKSKRMRVLSLEEMLEDKLTFYIDQAIALNHK